MNKFFKRVRTSQYKEDELTRGVFQRSDQTNR